MTEYPRIARENAADGLGDLVEVVAGMINHTLQIGTERRDDECGMEEATAQRPWIYH